MCKCVHTVHTFTSKLQSNNERSNNEVQAWWILERAGENNQLERESIIVDNVI